MINLPLNTWCSSLKLRLKSDDAKTIQKRTVIKTVLHYNVRLCAVLVPISLFYPYWKMSENNITSHSAYISSMQLLLNLSNLNHHQISFPFVLFSLACAKLTRDLHKKNRHNIKTIFLMFIARPYPSPALKSDVTQQCLLLSMYCPFYC